MRHALADSFLRDRHRADGGYLRVYRVGRALEKRASRGVDAIPRIDSFLDFLTAHARVKSGSRDGAYHFKGREALRPIVGQLDAFWPRGDHVSLALCGGAQFGKTVLMLNLLAYLVAVSFRNVGYYLPDDDLVAGLVDGKLRPMCWTRFPGWRGCCGREDPVAFRPRGESQGRFSLHGWLADRAGFHARAGEIPDFVFDGCGDPGREGRSARGVRALLIGRMTASDLRLSLIIGTQRYHGAGQNLAFTEGTQHVGLVRCPGAGNGIIRRRYGRESAGWRAGVRAGRGRPDGGGSISLRRWRQLVLSLSRRGKRIILGCPDCGTELDREHPEWHAQAPEREALAPLEFPDFAAALFRISS